MEEELIFNIMHDNIDKVKQILANKIDIETVSKVGKDGRRPAIEFASFGDNFHMLYILWQARAKPTTPYLEEIFNEFENGKTPEIIIEERTDKNVYTTIKGKFSVEKLIIEKIEIDNKNGFEIYIKISNFIYKGDKSIQTIELQLEKDVKISDDAEFCFEINEFTGSFYILNSHNPIDVKKLKINSLEKTIFLELYFDFEYERTGLKNQSLIINSTFNFIS